MLSTTTGGASQSPTHADITTAKVTKGDSSKTAKVKPENFSSVSPENASNQAGMIDEPDSPSKNANNPGNNNNNNSSSNNNILNSSNKNKINSSGGVPSGSTCEQGGGIPSSTTCGLRQKNNTTSPPNVNLNNASDQLNAGTTLSKIVTTESDINHEDILKKKNSVKEEDCGQPSIINQSNTSGNSTLERSSQSKTVGNNNKVSNVGGVPVATVKEENSDILGNLVNLKKEDNFSPSMSPVGFGSIGNIIGPQGNIAPDRSVTPVKMELVTNVNEKTSSSLSLNNSDDTGCNVLESDRINDIPLSSTNLPNGPSGGPNGSGTGNGVSVGIGTNVSSCSGGNSASNFLGNNTAGNSLGSCLDYMQQQNHIFVFSTQLANNGAESVLSGQFQTIIAYHCTQPATKSFLEDFFMKNPMKMNKLQRQNSMGLGNLCGMSGPSGQPWHGTSSNTTNNSPSHLNANSNPNLSKMLQPQQKGTAKTHFSSQSESNISKRNNFSEKTANDALVNETDLMCWETENTNRKNIDSAQVTSVDAQALKLLEGVDGVLGKCNSDLSNDNNIVSLQGVKVPDENLTPQQRQHREEQLAKIKKMNQFLFPENDNGPNQLNSKMANDAPTGNIMMTSGATSAQMRQMQMQMQAVQKSDHMSVQLNEDVLMPMPIPLPAEVISEIGSVISCNSGQKNNLSCGPQLSSSSGSTGTTTGGGGAVGGPVGGGINVNMNAGMHSSNNPVLVGNSPDLMSAFANSNCVMSGMSAGDKSVICNQESMLLPQGGMTSLEWNKLQQQFFEERLKVGKAGCRSSISGPGPVLGTGSNSGPGPSPGPITSVQQPPITTTTNANVSTHTVMRNNIVQGPPPPYHPTQRSASVPIATQSPNPSSPNNLSLPSPRTAGALGLPSNSPNMDLSTTNPSGTTSGTGNIPVIATSKSCFQTDGGSPSSRHRTPGNSSNALNHHLNSNPSTPLAHISPKELETFNSASSGGDLKTTRPSPQRPRSPVNNVNSNSTNHLNESSNLDSRFTATSPGVNFNASTQIQNNQSSTINPYKNTNTNNPLERQNCGVSVAQAQFSRRSDNMPLNPNSSNRSSQNKISMNFDPISSLAQMSQQLTNCVPSGASPAGGINVINAVPGPVDLNLEHSSNLVSSLDGTTIDHLGHGSSGSNGPNSCHSMNPLINSVGQRMITPKIAGMGPGFSPGSNNMVRDGNGPAPGPGFHGILPPGARMMGRMPVNFGPNFNPNIQVKASTPNTIQYMPIRTQNNANNNNNNGNNNGNVRMAPSLEFLQRYANPQMANNVGGHGIGNDINSPMMMGPGGMNMNLAGDQQQNKIGNNHGGNNGIGMHFFQNCNQLPGIDDEGAVAGVGIPGYDVAIGQGPMIRGMRPHGIRQHSGMGVRLQTPGGNIANRHQSQFTGGSDGLDCNDPNLMFNNSSVNCNNSQAMFVAAGQQQAQQKGHQQLHSKPMPAGLCPTQGVSNAGLQNSPGVQLQGPGHHQSMGGPTASSLISATNNTGAVGGIGVNFVGPSSNDLKYAQQYHSFQQQLYATNTRSQQQQQQLQQGSGNMNPMQPNLSPNPAFFVSK